MLLTSEKLPDRWQLVDERLAFVRPVAEIMGHILDVMEEEDFLMFDPDNSWDVDFLARPRVLTRRLRDAAEQIDALTEVEAPGPAGAAPNTGAIR